MVGGILRRLATLALLVVAILIAVGLAEIAVRATVGPDIPLFPRYVTGAEYDGWAIRRNVPGARYVHTSPDGRWAFRINSQGFRADRDYPREKPVGRLRVLTLGDSFTVGYEVAQDETFSAVLERYLRRRGLEAEVINAGVSGFGNAEQLVFLEHEGLGYDPDVVVLGFFANDPTDNVRSGLYALEGGELVARSRRYLPAIRVRNALNAVPPYRWMSERSYLHAFLNTVASAKVRSWMYGRNAAEQTGSADPLAAAEYERRLALALVERMVRLSSERGIPFILLDINEQRADDGGTRLVRSFPIDHWRGDDLLYLDSGEFLRKYDGLAHLYRPRGHRHWSPLAHLLAAEKLGETILALVGKTPGKLREIAPPAGPGTSGTRGP